MLKLTMPSAIYFHRNRGKWLFSVRFRIRDWAKLWSQPIAITQKIRLAAFTLCPTLIGPFHGKTHVTLNLESHEVHHLTELWKWGICFYRSKKIFSLHENGTDLTLRGQEFYWPLLGRGIPFPPQKGVVQANTVTGTYQMPLMGIPCHCEVTMSREKGQIEVQEAWISGKFTLTQESFERLLARFEESPA